MSASALAVVVAGTAGGASPSKNTLKPAGVKLSVASSYETVKSSTGRIAQTDPSLLGQTSSNPINVLVKYDFDATASYKGDVKGYEATSPRKTGRKLRENRDAVQRYESYVSGVAARISDRVRNAVPAAQINETLKTVYGGVAARVPANKVSELLAVEGVVAVQKDELRQPVALDEAEWIGATEAWSSLGGSATAGDGVIVGVIDTGIWPEHPMLADHGNLSPNEATYACEFGDGSNPNLGDPFTCNEKLVGAYNKLQTYMAFEGMGGDDFCDLGTGQCSARDSEGHGTHTATTAAGGPVASAPMYGVDRGPVSGIAPGAKVIAYRVCGTEGCFNSDSVSAVEQAIVDGVDVINFSISGGNSPYTDPVELAFLDAFNAGISVNASAGNEGPGPGTSGHLSPWVTTVGASTSNRFFTSTLHLSSSDGAVFDKEGVTVTSGIATPTDVVLASSFGDALCLAPFAPGSVTGKVVACQRGTNARVEKGYNVLQGGAAGMILYNPAKTDVETDNHWLPAIHLEGPNADLVAFISGHPNVKASWASGTNSPTRGDVMAAFSSRGIGSNDFIKPDITAPGIQVLAGMTPEPSSIVSGPPGELYQAIAGTSMSSPHSAGASALVKAAHPDWTPAMIKSALMTSSVQDSLKEDGVTPTTPFDDGSGALRVNRAINPTLVFDETFEDYVASATDPLGRINLNLASVNAPTMPGTVWTYRTATNVTGQDQTFDVDVEAPAGVSIKVGNGRSLRVDSRRPERFRITISAPEVADGQYFGRITLDPRRHGLTPVTIPVAFQKRQGSVNLVSSCAPTTFQRRTGSSHCTVAAQNFDSSPANVKLMVTNEGLFGALRFSNIGAPAGTLKTPFGFLWRGQLSPALAPTITGVGPSSDGFGYIPLDIFGGNLVLSPTDESITNVNVPAYKFGQEDYTQIGVVSNGYAVVGGGTAQDVDYVPQTLPNTAPPNNVLAPFWTDLNPPASSSSRVLVNVLSDGVNDYLFIDYQNVPIWGTSLLQTFEVVIQLGAEENIWYEYASITPDPATPWNVGAENRDGSSGVNVATAPAAGDELKVATAGPTPGGSVSIDYDVSSRRHGTFSVVAQLTSDVTPGVTQQVTELTVTK